MNDKEALISVLKANLGTYKQELASAKVEFEKSMDDAIKTSHVTTVALVPVAENKFFIDGHRNGGMQDLKITLSNKGLILTDGPINFPAGIINP